MEQGREVQLQQMLTTQERLTHQLHLTEAETLVCAYSFSVKTTAPHGNSNLPLCLHALHICHTAEAVVVAVC